MSAPRLLVFTLSFVGEESSELWARIYEEYQSLSKKFKLIVITEEITSEDTENISLVKIPKISFGPLRILYRMLVMPLVTLKQRKQYDIIFIRVLDYSYMFAGVIAKKLFKIKLIIWLSNTEPGLKGIQNKLYKLLYKKTLQLADIIAISSSQLIEDTQNYIGTIEKSKTVIVKSGINTSKFKPLNIEKNTHEILYVGRIHKVKGIEDIIHALHIVIETVPDTKLKIISKIEQNSYYEYLTDLISKLNCEKNIEFMGPIRHNQLINHYNSASIFVLTSRSEGSSQATLEAMACDLPVIVTSVGTLAELIKDGENGFLVKPNQPNIIAEKIILLFQNKSLRSKIGKAARQTLIDKENFDSYIDELSKLISNVSPR